jgi:RNA polymerase sigma factor (sigma-70 family)
MSAGPAWPLLERSLLQPVPEARYSDRTPVFEPDENDPLLQAYLDAPHVDGAESALSHLVEHHVRPLLGSIVRQKASATSAASRHDVEELLAEGVAHMVARLMDLRSGANPEPILSLSGYVAVVAYNAWHRFLRARFPVRARLKNRLRYIASHHPQLALWNAAATATCGLRKWQGRTAAPAASERLRSTVSRPDVLEREVLMRTGHDRNEACVAAEVIRFAGGPIALDELVDAVGAALGIADVEDAVWSGDDEDDSTGVESLPDTAPSVLTALTEREELSRIWSEIQELPVRQRLALLLNLKDAEGRGVIGLLPLTGTASIRSIADALEMPHAELAALWKELPLEDAAIAARLGLTRQQVINLRKSARGRLARRMRPQTRATNVGS